jgi:hypothetical protein
MIEMLLALLFGAFVTGPFLWENLPTCHLEDPNKPPVVRCREVHGVFGGTVDGRIHDPFKETVK